MSMVQRIRPGLHYCRAGDWPISDDRQGRAFSALPSPCQPGVGLDRRWARGVGVYALPWLPHPQDHTLAFEACPTRIPTAFQPRNHALTWSPKPRGRLRRRGHALKLGLRKDLVRSKHSREVRLAKRFGSPGFLSISENSSDQGHSSAAEDRGRSRRSSSSTASLALARWIRARTAGTVRELWAAISS